MTFSNERYVSIGDIEVGDYREPRFISEIGVNHLGNFDRMKI